MAAIYLDPNNYVWFYWRYNRRCISIHNIIWIVIFAAFDWRCLKWKLN
jgi:hypothetical protein